MIYNIKKYLKIIGTKRFILGYFYNLFCNFFKINDCFVFLESHNGKDFYGNPYYIAEHLLTNPLYNKLHLIIVAPSHRRKWINKQFKSTRITIIKPRSLRYCFYLAISKWLITDVTFPLYFSRRDHQEYLNTWHGTPLKVLGRYVPKGTLNQLQNSQRNFLQATCILAPNLHTEKVLLDSYILKGICEDKILRAGYPRNDVIYRSKNRGNSSHKKEIAFMPTWRGEILNRKSESRNQINNIKILLDQLDQSLPTSIQLSVKLHPLIEGDINLDNYSQIKPFPSDVETYRHLAQCDLLITDYSSVFFDFAASRRPIIRYIHDKEEYELERGFSLDPDTIPFPCAKNPKDLLQIIQTVLNHATNTLDLNYDHFIQKFNNFDLGNSTEEICKQFFLLEKNNFHQSDAVKKDKQNVALFLSNDFIMSPPSSYLEIFRKLDKGKYSFTFLIDANLVTDEWEIFLREMDSDFGYISVYFHPYISPLELLKISLPKTLHKKRVWCKIVKREYKRIFGQLSFDQLILCGHDNHWFKILEHSGHWEKCYHLNSESIVNGNSELKDFSKHDSVSMKLC